MIGAQAYYRNFSSILSSDKMEGRRALCMQRSYGVNRGGAYTSEDAGMSSVMQVRTLHIERMRFPQPCQSAVG